MHSDRTHSDNRKHARTHAHTHPGSSITVATPLLCCIVIGCQVGLVLRPVGLSILPVSVAPLSVGMFVCPVSYQTHIYSPQHIHKHTHTVHFYFLAAWFLSVPPSYHLNHLYTFSFIFLLLYFCPPPFLHLSLTHKLLRFIFHSQIAFFFISPQYSLNVSSCHTPPIASPPVPLLPPPQLKTLMSCQLLPSPSFSRTSHTTISPSCPSLLFLPSLLWTSHSFITLVYSVASGYTTLLPMLYCCLLSFIYSLLPSPLPSLFSFFIYHRFSSPVSVSPQFTITMISVSVASLQAAAFIGHL